MWSWPQGCTGLHIQVSSKTQNSLLQVKKGDSKVHPQATAKNSEMVWFLYPHPHGSCAWIFREKLNTTISHFIHLHSHAKVTIEKYKRII